MSNFELIDDYLTNKLNEQDRKSFEKQVNSDPVLKADLELQQEIIYGLKAARVAELKAMLNKVPVSTPVIYLSPLRIAAGLAGAAVLATAVYFYVENNFSFNPKQMSSSMIDSIRQEEQISSEILIDSAATELNNEINVVGKKHKEVNKVRGNENNGVENSKETRPVIDLMDPSEEFTENEVVPEKATVSKSTISVSRITVNVISSERKLKSHYQFANGKLILYGDYDNGLYEIIEVNAESARSLFLFYKTKYYLLDDSKKEVTLLSEISDPNLIQKLNEFRAN